MNLVELKAKKVADLNKMARTFNPAPTKKNIVGLPVRASRSPMPSITPTIRATSTATSSQATS